MSKNSTVQLDNTKVKARETLMSTIRSYIHEIQFHAPNPNDAINDDGYNPTITIENDVYFGLVSLELKNETHTSTIRRLVDFYKTEMRKRGDETVEQQEKLEIANKNLIAKVNEHRERLGYDFMKKVSEFRSISELEKDNAILRAQISIYEKCSTIEEAHDFALEISDECAPHRKF